MHFVGGLDLRQFLTVTLIGLRVPPAWDLLTFAQLFDNLLDCFLGYAHFFSDLRADSIKFSRDGQLFIACLDLFNLLRCWLKGRWRWSFLAFRPGWSCRSRLPWLRGLAVACLPPGKRLSGRTSPGPPVRGPRAEPGSTDWRGRCPIVPVISPTR